MTVATIRSCVNDLAFHVFERTVHPELLAVCAEADVECGVYNARLRLCDSGHAIEFHVLETTITEVVASREESLPRRRRYLQKSLRGGCDERLAYPNGVEYQACCQLERLDPEVYLNYHEELLSDCRSVELSHRFPAVHRLSPGPISLMRTESTPRSLLVHAFHTFPDDSAVVKTQSLFEF